jgi:hypothetical protein
VSADNFYVVRKHPLGGFASVIGFASDLDDNDEQIMPEARITDTQYKTWQEAFDWASRQYAEYGLDIHPECFESKSQTKRVITMLKGDMNDKTI